MNSNKDHQLKRILGGGFAFAACVGGIIGLGILRTPGEITAVFADPWVYVSLWIFGGLFALMSIAVIAELVGMTPRSGGSYPLVRRAYGPYPGFLIGWVDWLSFSATLALKVTVLVEYLGLLMPMVNDWNTSLAIVITSVFGTLQLFSVRLGAGIQQAAAIGMSITIVGFTLALFIGGPADVVVEETVSKAIGLSDYGLVAAAIIFTYDGWIGATYFSGEIKGGGGVVARACVKSVAIILLLYVILNAALAYSVPLEALAGQELALSGALQLVFGPGAATVVIVVAVMILLAHQNLNYLQAPRILYALSNDGFGSRSAAKVGKGGNPVIAVLMTWMLAIILILSGGFEFLLNLNVLFFLFIYIALLVGVSRLRKMEPLEERPYRAWGHPWTTLIGILGWTAITVFMILSAPQSALSAAFMFMISVPVYLAMVKYQKSVAAEI